MTAMHFSALDTHCVQTLRALSLDMIDKANSGHPGLPLGCAPMAYVLWQYHLRHAPERANWPNRDRFILSAGHGSALLYALLHTAGYSLPMAQLEQFRQLHSQTPGHPEFGLTPGVEATTGPLGQGMANGVGMAIAERALAHQFNRPNFPLFDHRTYVLASDGDLMEGVANEAASLAGKLQLGKLCVLYDANQITLDGPLSLSSGDDVAARFVSFGWDVQEVAQGDSDLDGIHQALQRCQQNEQRPSLVIVRTTIGFGSPAKAGSAKAHGSPLGAQETARTKQNLDYHQAPFVVSEAAQEHFKQQQLRGEQLYAAWQERYQTYGQQHPELAKLLQQVLAGQLPPALQQVWQTATEQTAPQSTRAAASAVLQQIGAAVPNLLCADADLASSTLGVVQTAEIFDGKTGSGRTIRCGIREHGMAAIANGIAYHGGLQITTATFLTFSDYMRPAMRLAAMNHLPVRYIFTHDSVGLGEDGPTHQPIEHLMALRAIPNLWVLRPADAFECRMAWKMALERPDGPSALILSRQNLPPLPPLTAHIGNPTWGAYVVRPAEQPIQLLLLATGSEVHLALAAQEVLRSQGIGCNVISMLCWEAFQASPPAYQAQILPPNIPRRISIEAGITLGWQRYTGSQGQNIGIDRYGLSGPGPKIMEVLGLTKEAIVNTALQSLKT